MTTFNLGVCTWALDRYDVLAAMRAAREKLDVSVAQIGFFGSDAVQNGSAEAISQAARALHMTVAGAFLGFDGEDYASISRVGETGGLAPDDRFRHRLDLLDHVAGIAVACHAPSVAIHVGTIPADRHSPLWEKLLHRVRDAAKRLADRGLRLLLETGREPAATLATFVRAAQLPNLGVNFDPANFVIYGTDDPVRAMSALKGLIELVHIKDAKASDRPGVDFGRRVPLGSGDAQIARVISKLRVAGYTGPLLLEGYSREPDSDGLRAEAGYVQSLLG